MRACGCGLRPRTLITGHSDERPSPESSPPAGEGLWAPGGGRAALTPPHWVLCWSTLYRWRGLAGPFKSPSGPPSGSAICASARPYTRKSKRSVTADVLEKLLHTCVLESFVD